MSILPYADFLMLTTLLTRLGEILKQENVNSKNKKREMTNQSDEKEKVPESKNQHDGNAAEQDSGGGGGSSSGISFIWSKNVAYIVRRPSTVCATLDRLRCPSASPGALAVAKSGMKTAAASQGIRVEWGRPPARDYPYNPEPRIRGALCMLRTVALVFPFPLSYRGKKN